MEKRPNVLQNVLQTRKTPLQVHARLNGKGTVVQARHPWIEKKVLRFGVARLTKDQKSEFQAKVDKLVVAAPRLRCEAPANTPNEVMDAYFISLETALPLTNILIDKDGNVLNAPSVLLDLYRDKNEELESEKRKLEGQVAVLLKASGERSEAERSTSVRKCWERFEERFQCRIGSQGQERRNVLRRIKCVLESLGWERKYASIERADLERAVKASKPISETEESKRTVDLKRFFKFLCLPTAQDGLGFINNPAVTLQYLSPKELQRRRRARGLVVTADNPDDILPKLDIYWRALYGTLCFAGLRLSEIAALLWDRIDFDRRIISVLPTLEYDHTKSVLSERPIKPLKKLWPILEEFKAVRLNEKLVFPRPLEPKESWFLEVIGAPKVNHLSRELSKALVKAGWTKERAEEPQRRARRYWETYMRSINRTDLIELMGGHTNAVGRDHYTDSLKVVEKVSGEDF